MATLRNHNAHRDIGFMTDRGETGKQGNTSLAIRQSRVSAPPLRGRLGGVSRQFADRVQSYVFIMSRQNISPPFRLSPFPWQHPDRCYGSSLVGVMCYILYI